MEYNVPSIYLEISPSMRHRDYTAQAWALECPDVKNNQVCHRMLYCCTHMATVGTKGLLITEEVYWFNIFEIRHNSAVLTVWIGQTTGCWLAHCTSHHEEKEVWHSTVFVQRCATPLTNTQSQAFIQHKIDHSLWYAVVRRRDSAVETSNSVWLVDVTYQPVCRHSFPPTTTVSHFTSWPHD